MSFITFIFDSCIIITVRKPAHSQRIAIIRMDSIGDFILWLDAAKEFRNLYPSEKITLVANELWSDLAVLLPYWDEVIPVSRKKLTRNLSYRFKILRQIRSLGLITAIHPVYSRDYLRSDSLIRATGASYMIGSTGDLSNMTSLQKKISDRWYSQLITAKDEPLMELQRNAEFIRGLGLRNFTAGTPSLSSLVNLDKNLMIKQPYFIIFPGASLPGRMWPVERFGELLLKLTKSNSGIAVLCGSRKERGLCDQIIDSLGTKSLNMAGKTSLPELVEVIRRAKFLVGNETSGIHVAAAVGTPSICILGGGHYGRFLPYVIATSKHVAPVPVIYRMDCFNCNWQCTQPHKKGAAVPCISNISVNQVLAAIEGIQHKTTSP
jgi:ADP-heptose:LPS heptosyltransferase